MAPFRKVLARAQARLKSFGLEISDSASEGNFVALYNGGALNNISKSAIENFVDQSVGAKIQIFLPKKSYAILEFGDRKLMENFVSHTQSEERKILDSKRREVSIVGFYLTKPLEEDLKVKISEKPAGIKLFENFISEEEEREIVNLVKKQLGEDNQELRKRAVIHFGREFDYETNRLVNLMALKTMDDILSLKPSV